MAARLTLFCRPAKCSGGQTASQGFPETGVGSISIRPRLRSPDGGGREENTLSATHPGAGQIRWARPNGGENVFIPMDARTRLKEDEGPGLSPATQGEAGPAGPEDCGFGVKATRSSTASCCCAQGKGEREGKNFTPKLEPGKPSTHQRQRAEVAEVTPSWVRQGCGSGAQSVGLDVRAVAARPSRSSQTPSLRNADNDPACQMRRVRKTL